MIDNIHIGQTYDYFDDGKLTEMRRCKVTITDIIHFDDIDRDTLEYWLKEKYDFHARPHWLYAQDTDYFIKGDIEDLGEKVIFVRTVDGGWFSLGWWAGRLDHDGSLLKQML